jgi:ABC-type uncharacterized transport system permease subunit
VGAVPARLPPLREALAGFVVLMSAYVGGEFLVALILQRR